MNHGVFFQMCQRLLSSMKKAADTSRLLFGGDGGDRTHDLLNAIQALSQLSYAPECIHTTTFIYVLQVLF